MSVETSQKVTASQLKRSAFLYVRQSTPRQVLEHSESTARQYAFRKRAVALGWQNEQVVVIDSDLGQSGASSADREGFQKLVVEVSMGRAGIVLGLEVSRLARNSTDWHRLLEICAITDTLILDEDGIYHPADFNDRLLLGLKGTMSEAELHLIRARMRGGVLNKAEARRTEHAFAVWIHLRRCESCRAGPRPADSAGNPIRILHASLRRFSAWSGERISPEGLAVSATFSPAWISCENRLGRPGPQQGHPHLAQSAIHRRFLRTGRTRFQKKLDGGGRVQRCPGRNGTL